LKREEKIELIGIEQYNDLEKKIFLQVLDFSWRAHLQYLEQLRQVIGLRSYGQKDPLSEFKKEAFTLFEILLEKIKIDVLKFLLNMNLVFTDKKSEKVPPVEKNQKVGRNDKCPCGSRKKFKHCCGSI
jgi:preprotein translocase subunit SecA